MYDVRTYSAFAYISFYVDEYALFVSQKLKKKILLAITVRIARE